MQSKLFVQFLLKRQFRRWFDSSNEAMERAAKSSEKPTVCRYTLHRRTSTHRLYLRKSSAVDFFLSIYFVHADKTKSKNMYVEMSDWEKVKAKTIFIKTFFGKGVLSQYS